MSLVRLSNVTMAYESTLVLREVYLRLDAQDRLGLIGKNGSGKTTILRLILGDQLNSQHSWFRQSGKDVLYTLMEVRQETDYVQHHIQKVAGFFAAMRSFSKEIAKRGHQVRYIRLEEPENRQSIEGNLRELIRREKPTRVEYLLPDEYRLDRQMKEVSSRLPVPTVAMDTEHFLTERQDVKRLFRGN